MMVHALIDLMNSKGSQTIVKPRPIRRRIALLLRRCDEMTPSQSPQPAVYLLFF